MSWSAKITAILENPIPNDTKDIIVDYTDGNRIINRRYNIHMDNYPTIDVTVSFIKEQVDRLNEFDNTIIDLEKLVGTEIK